jgi:PAS domain S-box-containing protein
MAGIALSSTNETRKTTPNNGYPMRSITETILNGFFTMDRNWTVQYWNKAAEKLLGVAAKDIVGKNLWENFVGIIPIEFYVAYPKAFLLELPYHFEEYWGEMDAWFDVIVYHCGDTLSVSFKNSSYPVPANHPSHPEERLKIQNELYRFVAEVSNDCLWEWELQTNELFWIDGGHKRVLGYDIENAFIPRNFWESRIHSDDKERVLAGLNKAMNEGAGSEWTEDYRFQKADGTYAYVHDRGYIIYDKNKLPSRMIGTTLDVTAAKLTEIKLAATEKELARLTGSGASGLAHQVKKPLGNITLSVEMLESMIKDHGLKMFLEVIMRSSVRTEHLMEELPKLQNGGEPPDEKK